MLSALDPGKQGLKPGWSMSSGGCGGLSALDPGKQGLKPKDWIKGASRGAPFSA